MKVLFAIMLLFFSIVPPTYSAEIDLNLKDNEFAITFLPLNHGEAAFLHLPNNRNIMINLGMKQHDKMIVNYLKNFHIQNVESVIITDPQFMNDSLLKKLKKSYHLQHIYTGGELYKELKSKIPQLEKWEKGHQWLLTPNILLEVIYEGHEHHEGLDFSITSNQQRFLWMSSTSEKSKQSLLLEKLADVNIIKTANFAQLGSMSPQLLKHIDPQTAVILKDKGRMPDPEIMQLMHEAWIDVYYTEQHGLVMIKFSNQNYEVITVPMK
ncbi:beta-lactamase superfamily II metal-dependent hydrolase [Oikeobacillus pervagus]|uniref:Beta-lactamase superfamily II metal-dependent hydrolase n=1 Tax=Oikeobacillus pervagus TaxID=1325931 RepID=A0AAJ1T1R4_9BACI|nr:hypothetical protein [Oikeobacillus pervagus]MDQ0213666.1 beta-lactamase superfamily II metal-dependent hydrolase [Oikeobacillus pervagus]